MSPGARPQIALAWGALALTVTIWASFLIVTRAAMTARLGAIEVGLIRFGVGALLFLPVLLRHGLLPKGTGWRELVLIPGCGGVIFVLLLAGGLQYAPVADSGVFTPGMMPLYAALLSALVLGERFTGLRMAGLALILGGALIVGGWEALHGQTPGVWRGHLMFTGASIAWATYTVAFRRSGLSPVVGGAMMCAWAALVLAGLGLWQGLDFSALSPGALAVQIVVQGVLAGFVATFTFFYAIQHLGASRAAACAAIVPVLAALGGWVILGETISVLKGVGIVVVALGVALASGAVAGGQRVL